MPCAPPGVVLDTNAVLDWLLFGDAGMRALGAAIDAGRLRWLACPRMREELARTLADTRLSRWAPDAGAILARFDARAELRPAPSPRAQGPHCSDRDDQVFIDLALGSGARWLVSKDKAVRRLAGRARRLGLLIVPPAAWQQDEAAAQA